jgi:hypothetical protein
MFFCVSFFYYKDFLVSQLLKQTCRQRTQLLIDSFLIVFFSSYVGHIFSFFILIYVMTSNDFSPLLIILPVFPCGVGVVCIYFRYLPKGSCSHRVRVHGDQDMVHTYDLLFSTHPQPLLISVPTCNLVCHPFVIALIKLNVYTTPK